MTAVMTPYKLVNIEEKAAALLAGARAQAADLLRQAIQEAEKLREQARAEGAALGRHEGLQQGLADGRAQGVREERAKAEAAAPHALRALDGLVAAFRDERRALLQATERDLLRLACAIGARLAKAEIARDPHVVERNAAEVIALAATKRQLVLRVHPDDAQALRTYLPSLDKRFADLEGVSVAADPDVARGGCLLSTPTGTVDARIETQLAQMEAALLGDSESDAATRPGGQPENPGT